MQYQQFTPEMRKTHTILVPNMLPIHFRLLISIFGQFGYHMELLESSSRTVVEEGLKNVHNDTCYPALLVVGQFIEALKSGKYDPDKTALLITQTGGGCRASNYIHLLRKCMAQQFPQVPVISLNFAGLEKASGFQLTLPLCIKLVYGVLYADLLMTIYNQCRPYELNEGESQKTLEQWQSCSAQTTTATQRNGIGQCWRTSQRFLAARSRKFGSASSGKSMSSILRSPTTTSKIFCYKRAANQSFQR